jgi:hypothetical protein
MSKSFSRQPVSERIDQMVPEGERLVVRDANGRKVIAFEAGDTPNQRLLPGHTVELVDAKPTPTPDPPDDFVRLPSRVAVEALMELVGVTRQELVAKAQEIRQRSKP